MDVLADLLERSRASSALFAHSTGRGRFGLAFEPARSLSVHVVAGGRVWLVGADEPVALAAGDVALVRGGTAHGLASTREDDLEPMAAFLARSAVTGTTRRFEAGVDGPVASFLCGAFRWDGDLCASLLARLPPVVVIRPDAGSSLRATVELFTREMAVDAAGQQTVLDRLLDVVVVHALRQHLTVAGGPEWFHALGDPLIGPALRLMHGAPQRRWTVAGLAAEVGSSRAAFARRFTDVVGRPPLDYLTGWRMALAREALRDTERPLEVLAREVGYASVFAFSTAFKRYHGHPPGRWRACARAAAASVPAPDDSLAPAGSWQAQPARTATGAGVTGSDLAASLGPATGRRR